MATATINDLPMSRVLDHQAMSSIRGADGAPWVFGAFRAFSPGSAAVVNFYQTNNVFVADQLNVQFQTIAISSSAAVATIDVAAGQNAQNFNVGVTKP